MQPLRVLGDDAQRDPGKASVALVLLPGVEVVVRGDHVKTSCFDGESLPGEHRGRKLRRQDLVQVRETLCARKLVH